MGKVCKLKEHPSTDQTTCCRQCDAGKYVLRGCDSTRGTECADCGREVFTATTNYLDRCIKCKQCNANQKEVKECLANEDRECECIEGFFCHDAKCEQCEQVTSCPPGQGVKVKATPTHDTVCVPCGGETFNSVSDHTSPCKAHTSCQERGRLLEIPGTHYADAICGRIATGRLINNVCLECSLPGCAWELPAGLWSGLVLTSLLVFLGVIFWRRKHKSRTTVSSSVLNDSVVPLRLPEVCCTLPVMPPVMDIHCQESCDHPPHITVDCKSCVRDNVGNGLRKTHPESIGAPNGDHVANGRPDNLKEALLCMNSEPQEDEWRGT